MVTEEDLIERLALEANQEGRGNVAKRYGVDATTITRVLDGVRGIPPQLASAMGYRKITRFEPLGRGA